MISGYIMRSVSKYDPPRSVFVSVFVSVLVSVLVSGLGLG